MTPNLPPNSNTISAPLIMAQSEDGTRSMFDNRKIDANFFQEVRNQLRILRDWDNYERRTTSSREDAKKVLYYYLDREH